MGSSKFTGDSAARRCLSRAEGLRPISTTREGVDAIQPSDSVREAIDTWEGEGGSPDSRSDLGNGRARSEQESVADGLSWETFSESFFPGRKRHYLPAISAWSRYRAGDRSRPKEARLALISERHARPKQTASSRPLVALVDSGAPS